MPDTRPAIRCLHCKLNQFVGEYCRRCRKPLPQVAEIVSQIGTQVDRFGATLPSLEEWEMALIYEAIRRSNGDKRRAAKVIGIGTTTIYRRLKEYEARL